MQHSQLSDSAKAKRKEDFLKMADNLDIPGYLTLNTYALILFVEDEMRKLTPAQRAGLAALTTIAGGTLVALALNGQAVGLALVVMLFVGWLLGLITRS